MQTPPTLSVPARELQTPLEPSPSLASLELAQRQAEENKPSAVEFATGVIDNDWISSNLARIEEEQGYARDMGWTPPSVTDEKAWEGVDPNDRQNLFNDSRSSEHFAWMKDQYKQEREVEAQLASVGLWSIPGRIALNMLDPVGLAASIGSGGLGILSKSSRMANAVRAGLIGGAVNAGLEGVVAAGSPSLDEHDVLIGGIAGFALSAPMGAVLTRTESTQLQRAASVLAREARAEEIVAAAAARGETVTKDQVFNTLTKLEAPVDGGDSVGAARAFTYDPVRDTFVEDQSVGQMAFDKLRTYAGVLRGSKNETVRNTVGSLVDDPIGTVDGSVSTVGATQERARLEHTQRELFNRNADKHFDEYLRRTGQSWASVIANPRIRADFMEAAGRWAKYGDKYGDPTGVPVEAQRLAADALDKNFHVLGKALQDEGVLDAQVANYVPRRANYELMDQYIEGLDAGKPRYGLEQIVSLYRGGMEGTELARTLKKAAGDDLAQYDRVMNRIASNFVRRLREVGRGIDIDLVFGINTKSPQYVRELILDYGGERDLAEWVESAMERRVRLATDDDAGKPAVAKHRMELDEGFGMMLKDTNTYTEQFVRIADLYDNNIENLFNGYVGGASGRIAAARISGFKTDGDFNMALDKVKAALPDEQERERVVARATEVWKYLTGRPLESGPDTFLHRAGRFMRNYNMSRVGWSFGLAQIADMGNVVAIGGLRVLRRGIPELRTLLKKGVDGQLENKLGRELREIGGIGTAFRSGSMWGAQYDEVFGVQNRAEFLMRGAARATAKGSGMAYINEGMQFLAAKYTLDGFASGQFPAKRLAQMGLSPEDAAAIKAHLVKHNGGTDVKDMGLDGLDPAIRFKMLHAVRKNATRAVQENDWGATFPFMHSSLGKILVQFRTFSLVALSKQSLYLAHQRDGEAIASLLWGTLFGSLSYAAYVMATKPSDTWADHFDEKKLATAALSRSGWASIFPSVIDTPITFAGFDPLFNYRNSGLPSNALSGVPTIEAIDRASKVVRGVKDVGLGERSATEKDINNAVRLAPLGTIWGMGHALNSIAEEMGLSEE